MLTITKERTSDYMMLRNNNNHPEIERIYKGMIQDIKNMINDHWDYVILVEGYEGSAKSSYAVNLACDIDPDVLNDPIDEHIYYDIKDMIKDMWTSKKKVFIIDEAVNGFFSRESMSKPNILFGKTLATVRDNNHVLILVIPNKRWLDAIARDHRIKLIISIKTRRVKHLLKRGYCSIYTTNKSDITGNTFNNWEFNMRFPDFPKELKTKYLELKRSESYRLAIDNGPDVDPLEDRNLKILKLSNIYSRNKRKKYSDKDIGMIFDISERQVRRIREGANIE